MKRTLLLYLVIAICPVTTLYSQATGIKFREKPWPELIAMAKAENKLIFLDAYASWCSPCKWMAANIFTQDTVGSFYNRTFICATFDMEKGEGLELRKKYGVKAYPTLLFIDPEGMMVHMKVGASQNVQDYIELGLTALDPENRLYAIVKRYESGERSPAFMSQCLIRLADAYIPTQEILKEYFRSQTDDQLLSRANWNLLYRFVSDIDSREFGILLSRKKEFAALYTKDSVYSKISEGFYNALISALRSAMATDTLYNAVKKKVAASGFEESERILFKTDLMLFLSRSQFQNYLELALSGTDKYFPDDFNMLNTIAWNVANFTTDRKIMEKACGWAKRSVTLRSEAFNNDTYAKILFKTGKKEDAIKAEKNAIRIAQEKNQSTKEYEATLKRMEGE